jgi:hypothetical protein
VRKVTAAGGGNLNMVGFALGDGRRWRLGHAGCLAHLPGITCWLEWGYRPESDTTEMLRNPSSRAMC